MSPVQNPASIFGSGGAVGGGAGGGDVVVFCSWASIVCYKRDFLRRSSADDENGSPMSALKINDVVSKTSHLERHPLQRTRRGLDEVVDVSAALPDRHPAVRLSDRHHGDARSNSHGAHS